MLDKPKNGLATVQQELVRLLLWACSMPQEKAVTHESSFGDDRSRSFTALSFEQPSRSVTEATPDSTTRQAELEQREPPACPRCRRHDVRRSHSRGPIDALARALGFKPFRCRACRTRYFAMP